MAKLLEELLPLVREAKIERSGRIYNAPQDYWRMALAEMIAKRDSGTLTLPLKGHGYLLTIIEGYNLKAEAKQEGQREDQRAGRTSTTTSAAYQQNTAVLAAPDKPRAIIPESVRAALNKSLTNQEKK